MRLFVIATLLVLGTALVPLAVADPTMDAAIKIAECPTVDLTKIPPQVYWTSCVQLVEDQLP